ncbi:MAG: AIR synthase family protein [Clostridia bacterium]|nr:AIR synthase family protein [Clostridia bacterium]
MDLSGDLCVVSSDPITAADENAGILSVLISLNDLAASGAEPVGVLTTVLLPANVNEEYIDRLFKNINRTCRENNIDILGGHTEVTDAVKKTIIVTTAIGRTRKNSLIRSDGARAGDDILMTKSAGLEGTAILCADRQKELKEVLDEAEITKGREYISEISVVPEGMASSIPGTHAMHDITEGGLLGAVWEVCRASGKGAVIYKDKIHIRPVTEKICRHYNLDPLKLISSGSMLIICDRKKSNGLIEKISRLGIKCSKIGEVTNGTEIILHSVKGDIIVNEPDSDEIYKVL